MAQSKLVVQRFSNTDFARAQLREITPSCTKSSKHLRGRQIELYKPGETRFATNYRMMSRLLELKDALEATAFSQKYKLTCVERKNPCPVSAIIGDAAFWDQMVAWVDARKPAYTFLRKVDTHKPTLHAVYESCLEIQEKYKSGSLPCAKVLQQQWETDWAYLHVPMHAAAYALHPRYREDHLQQNGDIWPEMLEVCARLLGDEDGALAIEQYNLYTEGTGAFGTTMAKNYAGRMEPAGWWKSYGSCAPQLQSLAMKVLSQPSSAASSEQNWSEYDFIHSKKRNRLKGHIASKLV